MPVNKDTNRKAVEACYVLISRINDFGREDVAVTSDHPRHKWAEQKVKEAAYDLAIALKNLGD